MFLVGNPRIAELSIPVIFDRIVSHQQWESPNDVDFCCDLLRVATELFAAHPTLKAIKMNFQGILSWVLRHLPKCTRGGELVGQIVNFFRITNNMEPDTAAAISDTYLRLELKKVPDAMVSDLQWLLTNNVRTIRRPVLCRVLFSAYWHSENPTEVLRYFLDLCNISRQNCYLCQTGKLEIHLMNFMNSKKMEECDELMNLSLELLFKIVDFISSPPDIYAFISLLGPVDLKELSRYHLKFLNTLKECAISARFKPQAIITLNPLAYIRVGGLTARILGESFSFSFRLLLCALQNPVILLTLRDSRRHGFCIAITRSGTLKFEIKSKKGKNRLPLVVPLPRGEWFDLHVSVAMSKTAVSVKAIVNEEVAERNFPALSLSLGKIKCMIARNRAHTSCYITGFSVKGRDSLEVVGKMQIKNDSRDLDWSSSDKKVFARILGPPPLPDFSMASVLVHLCSVQILIPLFAQLDMSEVATGPALVNLLRAFFVLQEEIQKKFFEIGGFSSICFLIGSSSPRHLTFDFYQAFITLFHEITYLELKSQLFDQILMNFQLWAKSGPELEKISRNWSAELYPSFKPHSYRLRAFPSVLFALTDLFTYSSGMENIQKVRANLSEIADVLISSEMFSSSDFQVLVGHLLEVKDHRDILDLIRMVKSRLGNQLPSQGISPATLSDASELHNLLNSSNDRIVLATIDVFLALYQNKALDEFVLEEHVNFFLPFVWGERLVPFLQRMLMLARRNPQLLGGLFIAAFSIDASPCFDDIKGALEVRTIRNRLLLWIMLCVFKYQGEFVYFLLNY
jgi:hypothetical protein